MVAQDVPTAAAPAAPRESIDVLQASASEVRATLAAVETQRAAAQAAVADAQQAAVTARSAVSAAEVAVAAATVREEGLREDVRASVVRAFVGGTGEDDLGIVGATNLDDVVEATRRSTFFTNDADQRRRLIEEHSDKMHAMAKALLEWETIDAEQLDDIMASRPPRPPRDWTPRTPNAGGGGDSSGGQVVKPEATPTAARVHLSD